MRAAGFRPTVLLAVAALASSSCTALGFAADCKGTEVTANFEQVGDLVVAANVQSSDVGIGTIDDIELDGWEARVTMCLDPDQQISADVRAVVRTTSLLGEKFVDLQIQSPGPPFLADGDEIAVEQTGKATELEDVFAKLAAILGSGNLESLSRFTHSQALILQDHADDLRIVLRQLRRFTDVLAARRGQIGNAIDSLDSVARTALADAAILEEFLASFASSSGVLANQEQGLQNLLFSLDRFTDISIQLLKQTESGLNRQLDKLRPVLRTVVENSTALRETLVTLATFAEYFPESMPGDYLQLDVCQAGEGQFGQGVTCPQSLGGGSSGSSDVGTISDPLDLILRQPLRGRG